MWTPIKIFQGQMSLWCKNTIPRLIIYSQPTPTSCIKKLEISEILIIKNRIILSQVLLTERHKFTGALWAPLHGWSTELRCWHLTLQMTPANCQVLTWASLLEAIYGDSVTNNSSVRVREQQSFFFKSRSTGVSVTSSSQAITFTVTVSQTWWLAVTLFLTPM